MHKHNNPSYFIKNNTNAPKSAFDGLMWPHAIAFSIVS